MAKLWGMYRYDEYLIERWERPRDLHKMWLLSVMSVFVHFSN